MTLFSNNKILIPCLIILLFVYFFKATLFPWVFLFSGFKFLFFLILMLLTLTKWNNLWQVKILEKRMLIYYMVLIFINCISCYYFRKQSIIVSLLSWQSFFLLYFYPCFKSWNYSIRSWEKILESIFLILLLCYILQYIFLNIELFTLDKYRDFLKQETRVRLFSDGILSLGCLFSWNKYLIMSKKKYLIFFVLSFFIIFLQGFRMQIFVLSIVSAFLYFKIKGFSIKIMLFFVCSIIVFPFLTSIPIIDKKIDEMISRNERDNFENDDYIRLASFTYFTSEHFKNPIEYVLGSGMTQLNITQAASGQSDVLKTKSDYSKYMSEIAAYFHYFTVDWGIIGLSWCAGIPFTILFIILLLKFALKKVDKDFYYLGLWEIFVLLIGITHPMSYYHNNLIYHALVFILIDLANKKHLSKHFI